MDIECVFFLLLERLKSCRTERTFTQLTVKTELKMNETQQLLPLSLIFLSQVKTKDELS